MTDRSYLLYRPKNLYNKLYIDDNLYLYNKNIKRRESIVIFIVFILPYLKACLYFEKSFLFITIYSLRSLITVYDYGDIKFSLVSEFKQNNYNFCMLEKRD